MTGNLLRKSIKRTKNEDIKNVKINDDGKVEPSRGLREHSDKKSSGKEDLTLDLTGKI